MDMHNTGKVEALDVCTPQRFHRTLLFCGGQRVLQKSESEACAAVVKGAGVWSINATYPILGTHRRYCLACMTVEWFAAGEILKANGIVV